MLFSTEATPIIYLDSIKGKRLYLKQDYLNHPTVSGNKLRKLKYNLLAAQSSGSTLISFGGAYSNHIAALAAAGKLMGLPTVGIIRGQELAEQSRWGHTLQAAADNGMQLHFVSRSVYREKDLPHRQIKAVIDSYPNAMVIPEGGSNALSLRGSAEVIEECQKQGDFDVLFSACGTGGTLAGLIDGVAKQKIRPYRLIGVCVLKGQHSLADDICRLSQSHRSVNWSLNHAYHFAGYAKAPPALRQFMLSFANRYKIPLEPVYTAKLCYAVCALAKQSNEKQVENWLIYHSGGLQGAGQ